MGKAVSAKRMRKLLLNMAESTALNCGAISHKEACSEQDNGSNLAYTYEATANGGSVLMYTRVVYGAAADTKLAELEDSIADMHRTYEAVQAELLAAQGQVKALKRFKKERKRAKKRAKAFGEPE